jgi:pimeloyl-ACP methyl ester carboxylesterase
LRLRGDLFPEDFMMQYEEYGPESAPTIVFLHGGGAGAWSWRYQVKALKDTYHLLVPELPGSAGSSENSFTFKDAERRVCELITAKAHRGRANVVGLSLGGQLGTYLLATRPELIDRAILSGTLTKEAPMSGCLLSPFGKSMLRLTLLTYWPFRMKNFWINANMKSYGIPAEFEPEMRAETQHFTIDGFMQMVGNENLGFRVPAGLEKAQCPVLVVVGEKEYGVVKDSARELVKTLPHAQAVVASGAGHNWSLEKPDLFSQMVRAWVSSQPLPEGLKAL